MSDKPKPTEQGRHLPYISDLERQLSAERETSRYWNEQWVERGAQLAAYKQKAESMLATSKRVNDQLRSQVQPLVDALTKVTELLDEYGESEKPAVDTLSRIEAVVYPALAKVKEGK